MFIYHMFVQSIRLDFKFSTVNNLGLLYRNQDKLDKVEQMSERSYPSTNLNFEVQPFVLPFVVETR